MAIKTMAANPVNMSFMRLLLVRGVPKEGDQVGPVLSAGNDLHRHLGSGNIMVGAEVEQGVDPGI